MIRVMKTEQRSCTVVTIDGQLSADCITVVETCCSEAASDGKSVHLHLRDITAVDEAGKDLLRRLLANGVCLVASGVYTSYLVQSPSAG